MRVNKCDGSNSYSLLSGGVALVRAAFYQIATFANVSELNDPGNIIVVNVTLLMLLALFWACLSFAQSSMSSQAAIGSGLTASTLKNLNYDQLPHFGVLPPGKTDHARGKGLILMGIAATSFGKGNWVQAHGLLGTSMLECGVLECNAYRSLFGFDRGGAGGKMSETLEMDNGLLLRGGTKAVVGNSIILRREMVMYSASRHLRGRFIYNRAGNYGRDYSPQPGRDAQELISDLRLGVKVYDELHKKGYRDETLECVLGTAYAVLMFDRVQVSRDVGINGLIGSGQVYIDALRAALASLRKLPSDHSQDVIEKIEQELRTRNLKIDDQMLLPDHPDQLQALLQLLEADLDDLPRSAKSEKIK